MASLVTSLSRLSIAEIEHPSSDPAHLPPPSSQSASAAASSISSALPVATWSMPNLRLLSLWSSCSPALDASSLPQPQSHNVTRSVSSYESIVRKVEDPSGKQRLVEHFKKIFEERVAYKLVRLLDREMPFTLSDALKAQIPPQYLQFKKGESIMQMLGVDPECHTPFLEKERLSPQMKKEPPDLHSGWDYPHNSDLGIIVYSPEYSKRFQGAERKWLLDGFKEVLNNMIQGDEVASRFRIGFEVPDPKNRNRLIPIITTIPFLPVFNPKTALTEEFIITVKAHFPVDLKNPKVERQMINLLDISVDPATLGAGILLDLTYENIRMTETGNVWVLQYKSAGPNPLQARPNPFLAQAVKNLTSLCMIDGRIDHKVFNNLIQNFTNINSILEMDIRKFFGMPKEEKSAQSLSTVSLA